MAAAIPEVHALGGDDVVVVACYPAAAGAGSTRQGADRALNCGKETEKLPTCGLQAIKALSPGLHQQIELAHSTSSDEDVIPFKNLSLSYCGWGGWGRPPRWLLLQVWCGHNSTRRWWFGTVPHSQWEEKKQPEET